MEVLELRTFRDLQYVRSMETLMRSLDARLRAADGSVSAKSFQVGSSELSSEVKRVVGGFGGGAAVRVIAVRKPEDLSSKGGATLGRNEGLAGQWGPEGIRWQGMSTVSKMIGG